MSPFEISASSAGSPGQSPSLQLKRFRWPERISLGFWRLLHERPKPRAEVRILLVFSTRVRTSRLAKGAATGAAVGAVTGNAGKGAAVGTAVGGMHTRHGRRRRGEPTSRLSKDLKNEHSLIAERRPATGTICCWPSHHGRDYEDKRWGTCSISGRSRFCCLLRNVSSCSTTT